MSSVKVLFLFALSVIVALISSPTLAMDDRSREPANVIVPVPENTGPRSSLRESESSSPVATTVEPDNEHLSGNWSGSRTKLSEQGIDLGVIFKYEAGRNLGGGLKVGSYGLWNLDVRAALDTEKLGWWKNGQFFFYGLFNQGANPKDFIGDEQGTSNIETEPNVSRLYEAWYQHSFADKKASVLFGLHDLNSEFYVTDTSAVFFNSSFGVGRELSQTGLSGPSIFPVTAPAVRFRAEPTGDFYLQTAVFNGVAGDPHYSQGTHVRVSPDDGMLLISEAALLRKGGEKGDENFGKIALGTWAYTKSVDHQSESRQVIGSGSYLLLDQALTDKIAFFARGGVANNEAYPVTANLSAGLGFREPICGRTNDIFGIAATQVQAGDTYKKLQQANGTPIESGETTLEITYRAKLWRGLVFQPDYQYIDRPGFSKAVPWAQSYGARLELNF